MSELKRTDQPDQPTPEADRIADRPAAATPAELRASREPYAAHLDKPLAEGEPTAREVLDRFDPRRANLPDLTPTDAVTYIETHAADRPWLASVRGHDTSVQRLFAALDQGQGHALERHEGYPPDSRLQRRVLYLEDPAQLDLTKRLAGEDAFKPGRDHKCADMATKIADPEAFATAFARGVEHPEVRAVLDRPYRNGPLPDPVELPIAELLGDDGHRYCSGHRLRPVGGDMGAAVDCRAAWVEAYRQGREPVAPAPATERIPSFERGNVQFVFWPNRSKTGYEVFTMYVEPAKEAT
ncbi:MAG: hypothetical protein ACJ73S_28955 [Mycobacteriales bacterium]